MSAYVVVEITVNDAVRYEEYKRLAPASIAAYGGRYIARGGRTERLEGGRELRRTVILEFPSLERAREWWASPEYGPAKALRGECATTEMLVVEGLSETRPAVDPQ